MVLILIGQGLAALQGIIEEYLLHDVDAPEAEIVSFEGIWGIYLTLFVTMPIANILPSNSGEGLFENTLESFKMLFHSTKIAVLEILFCVAVAGLNQTALIMISFSTAVHGSIYSALRSVSVWVLSVIVYYAWRSSGAGEPLSLNSILQGAGFLVMIAGTFIYNKVIVLPCFKAEDPEKLPEMKQPLLESNPE
jgi:hypothetical protein